MPKKLAPIRSETLQSKVYNRLKAALMAGYFAPNEELKLRDLAEQLCTSPMPVREALHRLVSERALVENYSNRSSVRVPELSRDKFEDLIRVRKLVEGEAVSVAVKNISNLIVTELHHYNKEIHAAIAQREIEKIITLNRKFHFEIYECAESTVLMHVIESLWLQSGAYFHALMNAAFGTDKAPDVSSMDHHESIIAALRAGNAGKAREAILSDIDESAKWFRIWIDNRDSEPESPKITRFPALRRVKTGSS